MGNQPDPLTNWGTSKVFYGLIRNSSTPKQISELLDISPPAVIDQLRRLQRIGIVKLGKKIGKFQHYEIDWTRFAEVLLDRSPRLNKVFSAFSQSIQGKALDPSKTWWGNKLSKSQIFQNIIIEYFKDATETLSDEGKVRIYDLIESFEETLIGIYPFLKKENVKDEETNEFLSALQYWYDFARRSNPSQDVFTKFFKELNLL